MPKCRPLARTLRIAYSQRCSTPRQETGKERKTLKIPWASVIALLLVQAGMIG